MTVSQKFLFESFHRVNSDWKRSDESLFGFLNRSGAPKIEKIRSILNDWFSLLPSDKRREYYNRLTHKKNFDGAFYELFLLALFTKIEVSVEIEPLLDLSARTPDFLLTKNNSSIFVEATTNECSLTSAIPNFKIREQIVGELNNLDLNQVRLLIYDLKIIQKQKPSIRELKSELVKHCKEIERNELVDHTFLTGDENVFNFSNEDLFFTCAFFIDKKPTGHPKRTVYADSYDISIDPLLKQLNKSVKNKKSRYGELNRPYVICVNFPNRPLDQDEILSIMNTFERQTAGFIRKRPDLTNFESLIDNSISALFISYVTPFNLNDPQHWFIRNPNAKHPIDSFAIPIDYYDLEEDNFVIKPTGRFIPELMGII